MIILALVVISTFIFTSVVEKKAQDIRSRASSGPYATATKKPTPTVTKTPSCGHTGEACCTASGSQCYAGSCVGGKCVNSISATPTKKPTSTPTPTPSCLAKNASCSNGTCCAGLVCVVSPYGRYCNVKGTECTAGQQMCQAEAGISYVYVCDGTTGYYQKNQRCDFGCDGTKCITNGCTPNTKQCNPTNASELQTCAANGIGWSGEYCKYGCVNNACKPAPSSTPTHTPAPTPTNSPMPTPFVGVGLMTGVGILPVTQCGLFTPCASVGGVAQKCSNVILGGTCVPNPSKTPAPKVTNTPKVTSTPKVTVTPTGSLASGSQCVKGLFGWGDTCSKCPDGKYYVVGRSGAGGTLLCGVAPTSTVTPTAIATPTGTTALDICKAACGTGVTCKNDCLVEYGVQPAITPLAGTPSTVVPGITSAPAASPTPFQYKTDTEIADFQNQYLGGSGKKVA